MPGLSRVDAFFGIHSFTALNRTTKLPLGSTTRGNGLIQVLKSAPLNPNQQLVGLTGGSLVGDVASERVGGSVEIALKLAEFPTWLFEIAGYVVTRNSAEASGAATNFANAKGTSIFNASTGIASISITTAADIKTGRYLVVYASATTVHVYNITNIQFKGNGTALDYVDESLKITSSALTITASTPTAIPSVGVSLTGGSGTIAFTSGDVAIFDVRKPNVWSEKLVLPGSPVSTEFEGVFYRQQQSSGDIELLRAPRCVITAFPLPMDEKQYAEGDVTMKVMHDPAIDQFFEIERIKAA